MKKMFAFGAAAMLAYAAVCAKEPCPVIPFLAVTGTPTEADVARKVRRLKEVGYDQFLIYARSGLGYRYMGEEWLAMCGQFCREAESLGMKVWLYDEYNWPSGTCKGRVPAENDAWRYRETAVYRDADGSFRWQERLGPAGWVNVLEEGAVGRFIELTHKVYEKRLARWMRNGTITGIFTDEPGHPVNVAFDGKPLAVFRWWSTLEADYLAETGRTFRADVERWLASGKSEDAGVWDAYSRLMGRQFRKAYFDQIRKWCDGAGLALTGHMICEDSVTGSCRFNGDPLHALKGLTIPGMDEIGTRCRTDDAEWITLNLAQHAAVRNGRGALAELFALGPNDMPPAKIRQMIWLAALHNVDRYVACMEAMDVRGLVEKHGYFAPMMEAQPWHGMTRVILDDASRAAGFARKTDFEHDVAVRYPQRLAALAAHAGGETPRLAELLRAFNTRQVAFDMVEESERTDRRFVFSAEGEKVREERTGRVFDSADAAAEWMHGVLAPRFLVREMDGTVAGDIVVRDYADGSTVALNLQERTDRVLVAESGGGRTVFSLPARGVLVLEKGEKVQPARVRCEQRLAERRFALALDRANVRRINFDTNKVGVLKVATPLKGVKFAMRELALSYAVTASGRPVDSFEKAPAGERVFRHDAEPYVFSLDGRTLGPAGPCTVLCPDFNPLYRETGPIDLAPGEHTLRIVSGEADRNFFLPALFVAGEFAVFNGVLCPLPDSSGVGPLSSVGLDDFSGAVTYEAKVSPPAARGRSLRLDTGGLFTSVSWNGRPLGVRAWAPYEWAIPDGDGEGTLRITVYPPMVNILGDAGAPGAEWDQQMWTPPRERDYSSGLVSIPAWTF